MINTDDLLDDTDGDAGDNDSDDGDDNDDDDDDYWKKKELFIGPAKRTSRKLELPYKDQR